MSLPPSVTKPSLHSQDHFFVQANCRFMPQASFPSVRDAVTCFPDTSIAKVSGYVCPPIQFADDTLAGHSRPISTDTVFTNRPLAPATPPLPTVTGTGSFLMAAQYVDTVSHP